MIHAMIDTERLYLQVYGHAGYAEAGRDIVCAGVSALAQALAAYAEEYGGCAHRFDGDGGDPVLIVGMDPKSPSAYLHYAAFRVVQHGLAAMAERYPEHITLAQAGGLTDSAGADVG